MSARITIEGNLTADPDFGVSNAGTSWARLRVASHDRVKRNGVWTSTDPEFFNVSLFGRAAEDAGDTLHKGDRVTVEGRPELELFDRRDGSTGAIVKVYARTVTLTINDESPAVGSGRDVAADTTPTIHHTSEATMVVGVGRTATALHRTLKDHGFRWTAATTSWNLPTDMDVHTRTARVSDVVSVVRENGRDIPVVNDPAPAAAPAMAVPTAGVAPSPVLDPAPANGRSL
ncbi:single-stranded DNA-binding protein [Nakamurella multipartita]|uniref:Single-strand binding protein n=1 Tax=Nakamurella multipartita (strain ATCC 700099 / DSM 44233 / CIP 104796 / JCM 9543 / NBRC 105858 / Y-104) TaxID=479431 RepID=C8X708_NAKMY|nr:single-stranded DNA-binding protein [Nakamurella multipartita]ACV76877.1 single-strand binding protein [Nakamurella multipartita DSM 44233]